MHDSPRDPTTMLHAASRGDRRAADLLLPIVYDELRRVANRLMEHETPNQTLQPTALVHEAYLRLVDQERADYQDRAHFAAIAATMLRRVLVDHARKRGRLKRGGDRRRESLERVEARTAEIADYAALDTVLETLQAEEPRAAQVVELRYFGGLTTEETATALDVSVSTVERDWRFARAWLHRALS